MSKSRGGLMILGLLLSCAVLGVFLLISCSNKSDKEKEPPAVITYSLSGRVVSDTGTPVSGASVSLYKDSQKINTATTLGDGSYSFGGLSLGTYVVEASKTGFTYGNSTVAITESGGFAIDTVIKEIKTITKREEQTVTATDVKDNGVIVKAQFKEDVGTGGTNVKSETKQVVVEIPKNTEIKIDNQVVTTNVQISVTKLEVNEVPPPPKDAVAVGNVLLEPPTAMFSQPVKVEIPLEIPLPANISIPVQKYENGQWKDVGTAVTSSSGTASAQVTEFGQIAVQPKVEIKTVSQPPVEKQVSSTEIPATQTKVQVEVKNEITFPGGLPEGISVDYALALIQKQKGISIGTTKLSIDLPKVSESAKPAAPLDVNSTQVWVQTCSLVMVDVNITETITLNIVVGGTTYTFTIQYTYKTQTARTACTRRWQEHQGNI